MATPNVGILTTAGKALIDKVNSGQTKISFSKVVFSSMDNSQLPDMQVKALTAIAPQEVVVSSPETTLDTNSGETRIRATGTNEKLADGVYVKTYGVFAKDDTGNEILYGVTVSPNPNYFPAYDGVTPQAVTYSYKTVIQETSNITMTNSNDVYVTQEDLTEAIATIPQPDLSNYVKTTDTSNWQKAKISADDGSPKSFLYAKDGGNITMWIAGRPLGIHTFWCAAGVTGNPVSSSIQGTMSISSVKNGVGYCVSADGDFISITLVDGQVSYSVLANAANVVDRNPDTGTVSKPTDFTNLTVNGGKSVATRDDLKSLEASAWRQLDNQYVSADGYAVSPDTVILYKIEEGSKRLYVQGTIRMIDNNSSIPTVSIALTSIVKTILTVSGGYLGFPDGYASSDGYIYHNFLMSAEGITLKTNSVGIAVILYSPYITYDELV